MLLQESFSSNVLADEENYPYEEYDKLPDGLIPIRIQDNLTAASNYLKFLIKNFGKVISYWISHPWISIGFRLAYFNRIFSAQIKEFVANASYVEIGYGETVNISIGRADLLLSNKLNKTIFEKVSKQSFIEFKSFTFNITQYPGGIKEPWRIYFDPPFIHVHENNPVEMYNVSVSITLTSPPVINDTIRGLRSGILRIKQSVVQQYGSFWKIFNVSNPSLSTLYLAFYYSKKWGNETAGTTSITKEENMRYVDILVRIKPYHKVTFEVPKVVTLNPSEIKTIPINITNLGNYKDTIKFDLTYSGDKLILTDPCDITLKSGEKKNILLGIMVKPDFIDIGTLHKINVQASSIEDPYVIIAEQNITIKTEGFYISKLNLLIITEISLSLILILFYTRFRKRKRIKNN
jgi:hypothetical protein